MMKHRRWVSAALVSASCLALAACGSSGNASAPAQSSSPGGQSTTARTSSCGPKPGVKATGSPIRIGAIVTQQPGNDFSDTPNMEAAYFACVNANGGVNGHPLTLVKEFEQTQPAQIAAKAHKLVQSDHVVAMSGNFSLIECTVDNKLWQQLGYFVIADGVAPECYDTPNYADPNMGARFSSDGAAQYVLSLPDVKKITFDTRNQPGIGYDAGGVQAIAKTKGVSVTVFKENLPIADPGTIALKDVQAAGPNGAVLLDFAPPQALAILQAATKLNLEDRVKAWGCDTPCDTDFLAKALGPKWNHKLFVNAELNPSDNPEPNSPQMALYKAVYAQYGKSTVSGGLGAFSEMGFVDGQILVHALESVHGAYTKATVNQAIRNVKNFDTGMLCEPWTYGPYKLHVANYADYTVTPENGRMLLTQGCRKISAADPLINAYYKAIGQP